MNAGKVISFYSYKGGVGRSFLVANAAVLLSRWGYRVLCVDWDLEAPGLGEYFRPWIGSQERPGLLELVCSFADGKKPDWKAHTNSVTLPGSEVPMDIMSAGLSDQNFINRMQKLDWPLLYNKKGFGKYLEKIRTQWTEQYDFILVDCRTGITDIGGICTVHLPDALVFMFTANNQSLEGVKKIVQQAISRRNSLPLNRAALITLPVPSRFDARGQDEMANQWMRTFTEQLESFYGPWLEKTIPIRQVMDCTRLPYFSIWTFGERLATLEERDTDPERISYHVATITAVLARWFEDIPELLKARDAYVLSARKPQKQLSSEVAGDKQTYPYDYYVSCTGEDEMFATELISELRARGRTVAGPAVPPTNSEVLLSYMSAANEARFVVLIAGKSTRMAEVFFLLERETRRRHSNVALLVAPNPDTMRALSVGSDLLQLPGIQAKHQIAHDLADKIIRVLEDNDPKAARTKGSSRELDRLAEEYETIKLPNRNARIRKKNELARQMADAFSISGLSRQELASKNGDGYRAALARVIVANPLPGDLALLLSIGKEAQLLHTNYLILNALSRVIEVEPANSEMLDDLRKVLARAENKALASNDSPLLALTRIIRRKLLTTS